jgi:hypothetical protein
MGDLAPIRVPSLFEIKDNATAFAEGLVGVSSAQRDAVRHCVAACEAQSTYGSAVASAAGTANEVQCSLRGGQTTGDRAMDDFNNAAGQQIAQDAEDCGNKPAAGPRSGRLPPKTNWLMLDLLAVVLGNTA